MLGLGQILVPQSEGLVALGCVYRACSLRHRDTDTHIQTHRNKHTDTHIDSHTDTQTHTYIHAYTSHTDTDIQIDRLTQAQKHTCRHIQRYIYRHTNIHRNTQAHRHTCRHTNTHTDTRRFKTVILTCAQHTNTRPITRSPSVRCCEHFLQDVFESLNLHTSQRNSRTTPTSKLFYLEQK